jgi:hypothetical protein
LETLSQKYPVAAQSVDSSKQQETKRGSLVKIKNRALHGELSLSGDNGDWRFIHTQYRIAEREALSGGGPGCRCVSRGVLKKEKKSPYLKV